MPTGAAHKRWWQIFEVVFGIPLLAALALQVLAPLSLPRTFFTPMLFPLGAVFMIFGVALVILARREFARHRQPTDPGHPTSHLIRSGVFSVSRNPLYLGGICTLAGIAFALDLPWVLVFLVPASIACHYILSAPEERYLAARFTEEYRRYADSVHRWIGRRKG